MLGSIRTLLAEQRNITLSRGSVSRILAHLGFSPQRPLYKPYKQDPKKIRDYLDQTYPDDVEQEKKT